jgi:hypothetical protein
MTDLPHGGNGAGAQPGELSAAEAAQVLSLGLAGPRRPVDELLERLREPDGVAWLERAMQHEPELHRAADATAADRPIPLDRLNDIKERSKERIAGAATVDEAMRGLAVYCTCVAAALAHHGTLISSQPREQWDLLLIDLTEGMPSPWRELLRAATDRD